MNRYVFILVGCLVSYGHLAQVASQSSAKSSSGLSHNRQWHFSNFDMDQGSQDTSEYELEEVPYTREISRENDVIPANSLLHRGLKELNPLIRRTAERFSVIMQGIVRILSKILSEVFPGIPTDALNILQRQLDSFIGMVSNMDIAGFLAESITRFLKNPNKYL